MRRSFVCDPPFAYGVEGVRYATAIAIFAESGGCIVRRTLCVSVYLFVFLAVALMEAHAQNEFPKHEFRGAWIATVSNLDWPKTSGTENQKAELIELLDDLKAAGINAVFFQVRTEADALYESELEPWSYWLTGEQGRAPAPFYDPLEFAIEEAHKRGIELHAWFNPFRADRGSSYQPDPTHVTVEHPEWILSFGALEILNPGIPAVRDYVTEVITDVIQRYDVDGVHFDDYFYPYDPITDEDVETFEEYNDLDFDNIGDWRRSNVNRLVESVHEAIEARRPEIAFGISPFGIWKSGVPSGIFGLDAYNVIFADAIAWLEDQSIDYLTPQLYWAFGGGQDYATLAPWWAQHASSNGRHLYPGLGLYKADRSTFANELYEADVIPRQVRFNREHDDIQGSVFFRAQNITRYHSKGIADSLTTDLYRYPALTPILEWNDVTPPLPAAELSFEWTSADEVTLTWSPPEGEGGDAVRFYAVYRMRSAAEPDPATMVSDPRHLLAVTGEPVLTDRPGAADDPYFYAVATVSRNSIEGDLTNIVSLEGRATAIEELPDFTFELHQNHPNPFRDQTTIAFRLDDAGSVTLEIVDLLGRKVETLMDGDVLSPGRYEIPFTPSEDLAAGMYFYTLSVDGRHLTRSLVVTR